MSRIILNFLLFVASGFSQYSNMYSQQAPGRNGTRGTVNIPSYATPPIRRASNTYTCVLDNSQEPFDRKRVSERKCEEYTKSVVKTVYAIAIRPDRSAMYIKTALCNNTVEWVPQGAKIRHGEYPHLAAVGWRNPRGGYSFRNGGTLISPRFVLTAGHSTSTLSLPVVVKLGVPSRDSAVQEGPTKVIPIKIIHNHPEYKPPIRYNDIALIELQHDVDIGADFRPACLWTKPDSEGHNKAVGVGWDVKVEGQPEVLQKVTLSLLENKRCDELLAPSFSNRWWWGARPTQMCAGGAEGGEDICQVNDGFPLQVTANDNQCIYYVMGVTSFGKKCLSSSEPSMYTRVSSYLDWIEGIVWPGE